jgi:hypothetical protein
MDVAGLYRIFLLSRTWQLWCVAAVVLIVGVGWSPITRVAWRLDGSSLHATELNERQDNEAKQNGWHRRRTLQHTTCMWCWISLLVLENAITDFNSTFTEFINTYKSKRRHVCKPYINPLKHSGNYMYRLLLTFNNSTFCPHSVLIFFVWLSL